MKTAEVRFGRYAATVTDVETQQAKRHLAAKIKGVGSMGGLYYGPANWQPVRSELVHVMELREPHFRFSGGYRLVLDFSGDTKEPEINAHIIAADKPLPSAFASDWGDPESSDYPVIPDNYIRTADAFLRHVPDRNVLWHIANRRLDQFPFVSQISHHPSSSPDFAVITDGAPKAAIHSLVIAKGGYCCLDNLTEELWQKLGKVLADEIGALSAAGAALDKVGYRVIINNGRFTQTVAQMHAHLVAGNPGLWPILPEVLALPLSLPLSL